MMGPFFPNGPKPRIKARIPSHFSDDGTATPNPSILKFPKAAFGPRPLLTIDKADGDIHGQRSTGRDLDRSETRFQHLPMGDIGGHAKTVLTVDMYGAGGPPSACDDNQLPHPGYGLEELTDRHLAASRIGTSIAISFKHLSASG